MLNYIVSVKEVLKMSLQGFLDQEAKANCTAAAMEDIQTKIRSITERSQKALVEEKNKLVLNIQETLLGDNAQVQSVSHVQCLLSSLNVHN